MNYININDSSSFDIAINNIFGNFLKKVDINGEERCDLGVGELTRKLLGEITKDKEGRIRILGGQRVPTGWELPLFIIAGRENYLYHKNWRPFQDILEFYSSQNYNAQINYVSSQSIDVCETTSYVFMIFSKVPMRKVLVKPEYKKNENKIEWVKKEKTELPVKAVEFVLKELQKTYF